MKYAIIQLQGKQFQVSEGDQITVDRLDKAEGEKLTVTDVLLIVDGDKRKIGQPIVKGAQLECEVLSNNKGEKIRVAKYKAKSRYRKVQGHRQLQSVLKILQII